jgi:hypothetical protein
MLMGEGLGLRMHRSSQVESLMQSAEAVIT